MNKRKGNPVLVVAVGFIVTVFLAVGFGLCAGAISGKDEQKRCTDQGGFYRTDGGCDLPYPKR